MSTDASTPLMRQYNAIKQQVPHALLFFRLGDFYELFFEDAILAARELEITLTSRNKEKGAPIPMCGVPYHAAEGYIARLIQKGHRVAICDQMEDPALAKKLVKREITRVVTPGTATDSLALRPHENNYLAAVSRIGHRAGVAHVDVSTGEFRVTEMDASEVNSAIEQLGAREVLYPADLPLLAPEDQGPRYLRTDLEDWIFSFDYADRTLRDHFHLLSLDGCGLANRQAAVCAAGAILHYLRETQRAALEHLDRPTHYDRAESMMLDAVTVRNLELVEPLFAGERTDATLLHVLDQTGTGMGGRLLRQRLLRPSLDRAEIEGRLDAVGELLQQTILRAELRKQLSGILDIERLLAKITMGVANPRDVLALGRSLEKIPTLKATFETQRAARLRDLHDRLDDVAEARDRILQSIADEPPINLADGGTIRAGCNADLDELRDLSRNGRQVIAQIEARERARTGIQSLKVRFNNVFGYYIEISKANQHLAPADYERKQTLVNAERFTTPELKDYERKVLDAEDKILTLEKELFAEVRKFAAAHAQRIRATAAAIAEIDVTAALAQVAAENRYVRPTFSDNGEMRILAGPPSRDRAPGATGRRPLHPQRSLPQFRYRPDRHHHRAQHGRQVHLFAAGRADRHPGANGVVRSSRFRHPAAYRPHLHAHRRIRQSGARPLHLHGGNDRDRRHPEHRHAAQLHRARRDRPRHRHLRWPGAGLGRGRAHPRPHPRQDALRHALSRAHRTGRAA